MFKPATIRYGLAVVGMIVSLVSLTITPFATYAIPVATVQEAAEFGPELLLLTVVDSTAPLALPSGVQLHAQLYGTPVVRFIASGNGTALTGTVGAVWIVQRLDPDTTGNVYYFVDATAPNAAQRAAAIGEVIYQDAAQLLVAVTTAQEATLVTTLPAAGIAVAALPVTPLSWPPVGESLRTAAATATTADSFIASLLPLLTEADLKTLIDELSGEVPVTIGSSTLTINTRYTFATRIQDAERYLHQYYTQLGMTVSYAPWTYGSYSGRNVIAELRGVEHPERIWLVGGHFDSISDNPYNLAPGADDNGSGTAATLLIAKILRDYTFSDTIRFVHFSGEEQGHWGSIVYARDEKRKGAQIMGYIDLDMIGWDGNGDRVVELHTGTGPKSNTLGTAFISVNERYGQGLTVERKTDSASRFSDHSSFWDQDYASFLAIENFFDGEYVRDRNPQYHQTGDKVTLVDRNYVARYGRVALATLAEEAGIHQPNPNATATPTPTNTATPTPSPTATALPAGCVDLISNGGFESSGSWSFGPTPAQAKIVTSVAYTGTHSVLMGVPSTVSNVTAHSSAYQTIALPATAQQLLLHYWEQPGGSSDGVDYRETLLLNTSFGAVATLERNSQAITDGTWRERIFDLTAYRGRTLVLYFNVYNNGRDSQLWRYLDQVALLACTGSMATPTPTPTVTPTATLMATAEPTPTPTLIATVPPEWLTERLYLPLIAQE